MVLDQLAPPTVEFAEIVTRDGKLRKKMRDDVLELRCCKTERRRTLSRFSCPKFYNLVVLRANNVGYCCHFRFLASTSFKHAPLLVRLPWRTADVGRADR